MTPVSAEATTPRGPLQVEGEVFSIKRVGDYFHLTVVADGIAERARPGSFVALSVGGPISGALLRRAFSIYRVRPAGVYGGTVEIVFAAHGPGTTWMAQLSPHDPVNVVGPLGHPFAQPLEPVSCALVGGGYGSAPLFALAERLRERKCAVHMVLGAATESRLFGTLEAKRAAQSVTVTTVDGSVGIKGLVTDPLPALMTRNGIEVVYSCGPMGMLRAVTEVATAHGAWSQTAVEESMACGIGVCMTCVVPVVGDDNVTRMVRSCVDGPVFAGDRVRWDDIGTVPAGTHGAPRPGRPR
ncbi:MAG: dihydroorotate dehydrogenase electron transfer subunit [Nocardioidaceae bacterium]|nr:dihydroorotate dehydrogenase electron transfer subunit [Nocardioidaceae bacterium]